MKRYEEITVQEAARLLANTVMPVKGMAFKDDDKKEWEKGELTGIDYDDVFKFRSSHGNFQCCAKVIETKPLITEEERKAIRVLFPEHNWGAWDENGGCFIYGEKPMLGKVVWEKYIHYYYIESLCERLTQHPPIGCR